MDLRLSAPHHNYLVGVVWHFEATATTKSGGPEVAASSSAATRGSDGQSARSGPEQDPSPMSAVQPRKGLA